MPHLISVEIPFCYGHRVVGHTGKCRHLHGHNGKAVVVLRTFVLNELDMVVDFKDVKNLVKNWIDNWWDHNFLVHKNDPLVRTLKILEHLNSEERAFKAGLTEELVPPSPSELLGVRTAVAYNKQLYVMKNGEPTAENMAKELFDKVTELLGDTTDKGSTRVSVEEVRIAETESTWASYRRVP